MIVARKALASTVGTKYLVAASGTILVVFVIGHMLGNLQVYLGAEAMNSYAETLKSTGALLWLARGGLLLALLVHVWGIARLTMRNRAARSASYDLKQPLASTYSSRHMILTGLVLLAFVIYHLLHFTAGVTHPEHFALTDGEGRHDVYSMVVLGFRQPGVAVSYIACMLLLGLHLGHGIGSAFRSVGLSGARTRGLLEGIGRAVAVAVVAGNISIPLACLLGLVKPLSEVL